MQLKKQYELCIEHELTMEEFSFLLALCEIEENPSDNSLKELLDKYANNSFTVALFQDLSFREWVELYPNWASPPEESTSFVRWEKVQVTEKFKSLLFAQDKFEAFDTFKEIFGKSYYIGNQLVSTLNPLTGETYEDIVDRYWKLVENGNLSKINAVNKNTANYVKYIGNNMNINKYLMGYEGYLDTLAEKIKELNK